MSTEDLASKDLAEWREKEAKHQLDLIEKNMSLANGYLIKTHKDEEIIEGRQGIRLTRRNFIENAYGFVSDTRMH
jgi:hypothetical protein